ncbi:AI-2E family transporter [Weissella thailandensis]|uniref:AI-2E family transporter n=1 Tax=Weissella thailandensis TaxID=89061 RepID=A0ABX9I264_9LACO|nr:AI-2E family transporter [Weissella thailandensis]NKY91674.1 AI-2E family transporter [Weissella thailandensis]RDS58789.1 AI-2E family transporter [Weissella thailandensis]GEP75379.1 AI-2E family transporter [Weissella thailandensis]
MLEHVKRSKTLFWTIELLAIALLVLIVAQLRFILEPIGQFIGAVFVPLIISGFLYYILNPVVGALQKVPLGKTRHVSRGWAITIVMLLLLGILGALLLTLLPALVDQIASLVKNIPVLVDTIQHWANQLSQINFSKEYGIDFNFDKLQQEVQNIGKTVVSGMATSLSAVIAKLTSFTVTAITVPVMTIYMLYDGNKLAPFIQKIFPSKQQARISDILGRLNQTLAQYISGQVLEMIFVGVFTAVGYFMIGQKYALLLGVFAGITNMIPYVGPYIGLVPALFVALTDSFWQAIWIIVVVLIVQQVDSNLIYPRVMGASLHVHPLTIIVLLLAAGNIAGIAGMILAVPFYAVIRTVIVYAWQLWQIQQMPEVDTEKTIIDEETI